MQRLRAKVRNILFGVAIALYLVAALSLWLLQPDGTTADLDALIAIAGLLAIVLSLGLTVTLLVAQHTAERHARALYYEFRRDPIWTWSLAVLGLGVVLIVASALTQPTISTAWAALALAVALGLGAAWVLPLLLDSLDPTVLTRRMTYRIIARLKAISRGTHIVQRTRALEPEAKRGIDMAASLLTEGIANNDAEVVREGVRSIRAVSLGYLREIPGSIGMGDPVVSHAWQHLGVAVNSCVDRSPILLLPAVLEEVRDFGVEAASVPNTLNDYEPMSWELTRLMFEVAARTLTADTSAGAAMATGAIGTSAVALVEADRSTSVSDPISRLQQISLAAIQLQRDHVAAVATHQLAAIAFALTQRRTGIMPPSHYHAACTSIVESMDAFVARTSPDGALARDQTFVGIIGMVNHPNVVDTALSGLAAELRGERTSSRDFGWGADMLVHALCRLAAYETSVIMTPFYALTCAYSAVVGAFAAEPNETIAEHAAEWWTALWQFVCSPETTRRDHDRRDIASSLLVLALEEIASDRDALANLMEKAVRDALAGSMALTDPDARRRLARSWTIGALATLGVGETGFARDIIRAFRPELLKLETDFEQSPARVGAAFRVRTPMLGTPVRVPANVHSREESIEAFDAILHPRRSRRAGT